METLAERHFGGCAKSIGRGKRVVFCMNNLALCNDVNAANVESLFKGMYHGCLRSNRKLRGPWTQWLSNTVVRFDCFYTFRVSYFAPLIAPPLFS